MSDSEPQPDLEPLKEALRRSIPADAAPSELRARVLAALDEHSHEDEAADDTSIKLKPSRSTIRRLRPWLAIAAGLAIGFGVYFQFIRIGEPPAPQWFADAMVRTHDSDAILPDHHLIPVSAPNNFTAIGKYLTDTLGHTVMVTSPGDGWIFIGAGICKINQAPAAHLMFRKGDDTLSVFSVSANVLYSGSNAATSYAQMDQQHQIAGFVYDNAVHCIVTYSKTGDLSLRQTMQIRDQMRASLIATKPSTL